ncbi:MAG: LUD domain-containing protein [Pseudomonadota bacterium]
MSDAREAIFQAIEKAMGPDQASSDRIAQEAKALISVPEEMRPAMTYNDPIQSFINRVSGPKVGASVDLINDLADLPLTIAGLLKETERPLQVSLQPTAALVGLSWADAGIALTNDPDDQVVVGLARFGIAETGSLVFHSAADLPILLNFLPAVHIVAIRRSAILCHLEDYAKAARAAGDPTPRNACLITGASGTTDIEGRLVKGAHGPRDLKVVIVDDVSS